MAKIEKNGVNGVEKWLSDKELEVVKKQFFPESISREEMAFCLSVAKSLKLNPLTKEIFFVSRKSRNEQGMWTEKVEPLVGRDGFLAIAHRTGAFAGIETTSILKEVPTLGSNGEWEMKQDLVAICKVWRKDTEKPFVVEVAYGEYVQKKKNGEPTKFWLDKPDTMIKKVAESQALRKAFNISGVYSPEEIGVGIVNDQGNIVIDTEAAEDIIDIEAENKKIINEEIAALSQLGLNAEYKKGYIKVQGNTFNKDQELNELGYKCHPSKKIWVKKVA